MLWDRCLSCLSVLSVTLVYCSQTVGRMKMKLSMQVGFGPGHIVLDGDPAPPPQRGTPPQFSAHVRCGQMAGWIKMPLGMEVRLGPGDFVLDGDPVAPRERARLDAIFGPCLLWPWSPISATAELLLEQCWIVTACRVERKEHPLILGKTRSLKFITRQTVTDLSSELQ